MSTTYEARRAAMPRAFESISSAAARYGVHPKTIRRRIARGDLAGYRFGPLLLRVDPDEVDALLRPVPADTP